MNSQNIASSMKIEIYKPLVGEATAPSCVSINPLVILISKADIVERLTKEALEENSAERRLDCNNNLHALPGKEVLSQGKGCQLIRHGLCTLYVTRCQSILVEIRTSAYKPLELDEKRVRGNAVSSFRIL